MEYETTRKLIFTLTLALASLALNSAQAGEVAGAGPAPAEEEAPLMSGSPTPIPEISVDITPSPSITEASEPVTPHEVSVEHSDDGFWQWFNSASLWWLLTIGAMVVVYLFLNRKKKK